MNNVSIKRFALSSGGATSDQGSVTLATFDAKVQSIIFSGCTIVRLRDGRVRVFPPMLNARSANKKAVWFDDRDIRAEFIAKPLEAYRAVTGEELKAAIDRPEVEAEDDTGLKLTLTKASPPIAKNAWLPKTDEPWLPDEPETKRRERWAHYR